MRRVLITGGHGFLGRNLASRLEGRQDCEIRVIGHDDSAESLDAAATASDVIFHLAGVNRPQTESEFETGNVGLTRQLCQLLLRAGKSPRIIFSSSLQAALANPYGMSKAKAEQMLRQYAAGAGAVVRIYRLGNIFGKWSRPHYNSVVATFCHNIACDLPIRLDDPERELELSYVDDVIEAFILELEQPADTDAPPHLIPSYRILLGDLAGRIRAFHDMRTTLQVPDFEDSFNRALYATYLSHVPPDRRLNQLAIRADDRGSLAEFIKQPNLGQIFVSRTKPGITRGNHYHHTKAEKFFVVQGTGLIRMRGVSDRNLVEYRVSGQEYRVIDIPPGFTHSITNVGPDEMVTLFWSSEVFDPDHPDTYNLPVEVEAQAREVKPEKA